MKCCSAARYPASRASSATSKSLSTRCAPMSRTRVRSKPPSAPSSWPPASVPTSPGTANFSIAPNRACSPCRSLSSSCVLSVRRQNSSPTAATPCATSPFCTASAAASSMAFTSHPPTEGSTPTARGPVAQQSCSRLCLCANGFRTSASSTSIRTFAPMDAAKKSYYTQASKAGVVFFRYNGEEPPQVEAAAPGRAQHGALSVTVKDALTWGEELTVGVDMLVLGTGMIPAQIEDLVEQIKLATGEDGFSAGGPSQAAPCRGRCQRRAARRDGAGPHEHSRSTGRRGSGRRQGRGHVCHGRCRAPSLRGRGRPHRSAAARRNASPSAITRAR